MRAEMTKLKTGERIRFLRRAKFPNDTQRQFAERCGVTQATLSNIETGLRCGTTRTLGRIAAQLGSTIDDLLND